jgi:hypothetical protein
LAYLSFRIASKYASISCESLLPPDLPGDLSMAVDDVRFGNQRIAVVGNRGLVVSYRRVPPSRKVYGKFLQKFVVNRRVLINAEPRIMPPRGSMWHRSDSGEFFFGGRHPTLKFSTTTCPR